MADKRIIELDTKEAVAVDDYVALDGQTGGTKKFLASQLGGKAEVMTEAEWEDLPDDKYTDNKVYVLTDAEPPESQLFAKVGSASLDTSADNLSDAINEHESDISTLNSKLVQTGIGTIYTTYPNGKLFNSTNSRVTFFINNYQNLNFRVTEAYVYSNDGNFDTITSDIGTVTANSYMLTIDLTFKSSYAGKLLRIGIAPIQN